jgi:DNA-binding MarR family transcriptional regulator
MDQQRNFGFLLKDLGRLYTKRFEERAQTLQLTLPQCKALGYLSRNEGASQARLADLAEIDAMTMVRILDYMESEGWVERRADPNDRRARCLYLKDKAKAILDQIWQLADETRKEFLADLAPEECESLVQMLERVHVSARAHVGNTTSIGPSVPTKSAKRAPLSAADQPGSNS